jgi:hypothetical protein
MQLRLLFLILIGTGLSFQACQPVGIEDDPIPEPEPMTGVVYSGDVMITDTVFTGEDIMVTIMPGTRITFGPKGMLVVDGDLIAIGEEDDPIEFIGDPDAPDHLILRVLWNSDVFELQHAVVRNGLIRSVADDNHLQYVTFYNTKQLAWDSALLRLWYSRLTMEDCMAYGNNRGEGILAHNMHAPIVRRCRFEQVPDAIEYIDSNDGIVSDNVFIDCADDAVDQNSCIGTTIVNNEFYDIHDRALELGSENFGSSKQLMVHNNLFVNCSVAINVKESSDAEITNATFYSNGIAVDVQTPADSTNLSGVTVHQSIFIEEPTPVRSDARSTWLVKHCLSDQSVPSGENNVTGTISFAMDESRKITISSDNYPTGYDASTMGYQQQE